MIVYIDFQRINENFWEVYPDFSVAGPTKDLYESDKSKKKDDSSRLMWTISLIWYRGSKFYNLPEHGEDGKIKLVFDDFYGDRDYYDKNKNQVETIRAFFVRCTTKVARRALTGVEEKLLERDKFLRETKYDLGVSNDRGQWVGGTADILDKMMANTEKLWKLYESAKKIADEEDEQGIGKGGAQESLSDSGEI